MDSDDRLYDWMQTSAGTKLWPFDIRAGDVRVSFLGHHLAREGRFGGAFLPESYGVAQHSVLGSRLPLPTHLDLCGFDELTHRRAMLFHDAHEGLGFRDLTRQVKAHPDMAGYCRLANAQQISVNKLFGLPDMAHKLPVVKFWDNTMLATEKRDVMAMSEYEWKELPVPSPERIEPWGAQRACEEFIVRFVELFDGTPYMEYL